MSSAPAVQARELTDAVNQLRRALRRSVRSDYPWDTHPAAQVEVLQTLRETGPARIGDLAERLHLAQSTVSALVGKLIASGLVTRSVDPDDRRAAVVAVTSAGQSVVRQWESAHRRRLGAALRAVDVADREAILAAVPALRRLIFALED